MFGSGSEENTKTRCVWLVNGVSVLTYEFFSKTAPSDNLSMRPAREMEPARVCVKAGGKSALSSLERQDCKCVFLPSALLSVCCPAVVMRNLGAGLATVCQSGAWPCVVVALTRDSILLLSVGDIELQGRVDLSSISLSSGKM